MADNGIRTPNLPSHPLIEVLGHYDAGGGQRAVGRASLAALVDSLRDIISNDPTGTAALRSDLDVLSNALATGNYDTRIAVIASEITTLVGQNLDVRVTTSASRIEDVLNVLGDRIEDVAVRAENINTGAGAAAQANAVRTENVNSGLGILIDRDSKRTSALEAAVPTVQDRLTALEPVTATSAILSARAAQRAEFALPSHRPGEAPAFFTAQIEGASTGLAPLPDNLVAIDSDGSVIRFVGPGQIAPIAAIRLEAGRVYQARFAVRRRVNPSDPNNDTVRLGLRWLGPGKGALPFASTVVEDITGLTAASGRQQVVATITATGASDDPSYVRWPVGTVYARPFAQTFGTGTSDIEVLGLIDITETGGVLPDVNVFDGRLVSLENADPSPRLDAIEAQMGGAKINDYLTRDAVAATVISETVSVLRIIRHDLSKPDAPAFYARAPVEPAHARKVQSQDGAWWELSPRQILTPEMAGALGGGALDTVTVQSALDGGRVGLADRYGAGALNLPRGRTLTGSSREFIAYPVQQGNGDAYAFASNPAAAPSSLEQTDSLTLQPGVTLERLNLRRSGLVLPQPGAVLTAAQAQAAAGSAKASFAGIGIAGTGVHDAIVRDAVMLGHDVAVKIDFNGYGGRTFFENMLIDGNGGFDVGGAGDIVGWFNTHVWPAVGGSIPGVGPSSNVTQIQRSKPGYRLWGDPAKGYMDWSWLIAPFQYGHAIGYQFDHVSNIRAVIPASDYTADNGNSICAYQILGETDNIQLIFPTSAGAKVGVSCNSTSTADLALTVMGGFFTNSDANLDLINGDAYYAGMSLRGAMFGLRVGAAADSFHFAPARHAVGNLVTFDPGWPGVSSYGRIELPAASTPAPVFAAPLTDAQRQRLTILGATPAHGAVINQLLRPLEVIGSGGPAYQLWNTASADANNGKADIYLDTDGTLRFRGVIADRSAAIDVLRLKRAGLTPLGADVFGPLTGSTSIAAATTLQCGTYTVATLPTPGIKGRIAFASNARALIGGGVLQAAGVGVGAHVTDIGTGWVIAGTAFQAVA